MTSDQTRKPSFAERMQASVDKTEMRKKFPGLTLTDDRIDYKGEGGPIAGCRAAVETDGEIVRRFTATRMITLGVFGLKKKKIDNRELYLTVEGVGFAFVVEVDPKYGAEARQMAARINALGHAPAALDIRLPSEVPTAPTSTADQLVNLAELHRSGALTDDEFAAAKARLLT